MNKKETIKALKELYKNIATTNLKSFNEYERAKLFDLYADIQNAVIFLETGQDEKFNPDWSCE